MPELTGLRVRERHSRTLDIRLNDPDLTVRISYYSGGHAEEFTPNRASTSWDWADGGWEVSSVYLSGRRIKRDGTLGYQSAAQSVPLDGLDGLGLAELRSLIEKHTPTSKVVEA